MALNPYQSPEVANREIAPPAVPYRGVRDSLLRGARLGGLIGVTLGSMTAIAVAYVLQDPRLPVPSRDFFYARLSLAVVLVTGSTLLGTIMGSFGFAISAITNRLNRQRHARHFPQRR